MSEEHLQDWFFEWFNSPYYHLLYGNRSDEEAASFVQQLMRHIHQEYFEAQTVAELSVLDLACGKGRHARAMHELGMNVMGVDLAEDSIKEAKEISSPSIAFEVADMRSFSLARNFNIVTNLFTSFGYFDDESENQQVIAQVKKHLLGNGIFVIDFLNLDWVRATLVEQEAKEAGGVSFHIRRRIEGGHILKDIEFSDKGSDYHYQERVQAIDTEQMRCLLEGEGFEIQAVYGSYALEEHSADSNRLIMIARK
ncbi:MAG: methyltransferase domain-containing protein [Flavobacteriales bacterium]|nr:methyltransferase domain-containing protein [Flavobacteriales bacterium]